MQDVELVFGYSAIALFRDSQNNKTELRVITVDAKNLDQALNQADQLMRKYAHDFKFEYSGIINAYEFGSDMMDEYGEVFSTSWESNEVFDAALEDRIQE